MSNIKSNREQNKKISLSENQRNPYLAKPEDFEVLEAEDSAKPMKVPFHGQCGSSKAEYARLQKETQGMTGEGAPLNVEVDHAGMPHSPGFGGKQKKAKSRKQAIAELPVAAFNKPANER